MQNLIILSQITELINQAKNIVTVSHRKPDGDTLGGSLGFYNYLRALGKKVKPFCVDKPAAMYSFMPGYFEVTQDASIFQGADLVCVFDAGDLRFAGILEIIDSLSSRPTILNIDHHATNQKFGDVNLVMEDASSTTEVVYHYLKSLKFGVSRDIAVCLLTGIVTDTSRFYNPAASKQAFEVAGELIRAGANINTVAQALEKNKSFESLRVWGTAFDRLRLNLETGLAVTALRHEDIGDDEVVQESIEGLSNFLSGILNAKAVLVLKSTKDGYVKGSLRTTRDDVDVSRLAQEFGGGGHKKAAGFMIKGEIKEIDGGWKII